MKLFISYRRQDSGTFTGRIYDQLKNSFGEGNVFRDVYDIPAGSDFRTVLNKGVNQCEVFLAIIGPQWAGITNSQGSRRLDDPNDFVRIEVELALNNPKTLVIPVLVDNAAMPEAKDLPESLRELCYRNAVKVRTDPDFPHDMQMLIRQLKTGRSPLPVHSRRLILFAAILLVAGMFLFPMVKGFFKGTPVPATETPSPVVLPSQTPSVESPTSTPAPTVEPVEPGQIMVLVAQIEQVGLQERDVTRFIVEDLVNRFEFDMPGTKNIRIREYKQVITSNDEALQVAEQTQAVLVIWGKYDDDSVTVDVQLGSLASRPNVALERGILERAINVHVKLKDEREETLAYQVLPALIFLYSAENEAVKEMSMFIFFDLLDAPSPEITGNSSAVHAQKAQQAFNFDKQLALNEISQAIKLEADNPLFYLFRGLLYQGMEDFALSDQDLDTALRIAPESWVMPYHIKGAQSLILNNLPVGIESNSKVIEKMPSDWYPYNQRGYLYFLAGEYELAREDINKAIELKPEMEWPYMWATLIALRQGRLEDASSMMSSMFQEQPNPAFVDLLLTAMYGEQNAKLLGNSMAAMGHLSLGQYNAVIQDTDNVLAVMPTYPEMYMLRGLSYCNLDKYADAESAYTQGLTLDPSFTLLHLLRAEVRGRLGNTNGVMEDITAVQQSALSENLGPYLTAAQSGQFSCKQLLKTK